MTKLGFSKVKTLFGSISVFNFVNYFARNSDNFAIGKFYGDVTLGLYDRAYKFLYMARRLINSAIGPVLFPSIVEAKEKGEDYKSHFLDVLGLLNIINFFISVPLVLFSKPLTLALWGPNWIGVTQFMPYIGAIIPLQTLLISAMDLYLVQKKDKAYVTLGIPLTLILVAGIVIGAFFSALHIVRFYALAFALVQTPVSLYVGHYRILNFSPKQILSFWGPKVLLTNLLIFSIWFGNIYISSAIMFLMMLDTFYKRQKDLLKIWRLVRGKLKKSNDE
jgi:PST family polysaccharide transporter